jgi:hypothetical protein
MTAPNAPEPWLRGPLAGVSPYAMPAAHALVQAREDAAKAARNLTPEQLWARPGDAASVGFHLRHIAGSAGRLLAYAAGRQLTREELAASREEGVPGDPPATAAECVAIMEAGIDHAIAIIRATPADSLLEPREVGRQRLPSNVLGLLFHVAEHTQRHVGQIVATAKIVKAQGGDR